MPKVSMPNMSGRVLDHGRIQLLHPVGRGSFGTVYAALDTTTTPPSVLAVKVVRKFAGNLNAQYKEIILHNAVTGHENVAKFHRVFHDKAYIYLVLDYCPGGDLWSAVKSGEYWKKDELVRSIFLQILDAVQWCHIQGVYHRDLKPNNILVSEDGTQIYLTDFGLASRVKQSVSFGVGTAQFRSPECHNSERLYRFFDAERNDIWAVGVIFASILSGKMPWESAGEADPEYVRHVRHPHHLRRILPISLEANYILQRIFYPSAMGSPTLDDIREMVLRVDTFFMTDKEMQRSAKLRHISDLFEDAIRKAMADDSDDSDERSAGIHSASLLAMEEGRRNVPLQKAHSVSVDTGRILDNAILGPSALLPVERCDLPTPPQPKLSPAPQAIKVAHGTSSTLVTSKESHREHKHRHWPKLSRSIKRMFGGSRVAAEA
ncbi:kinase-like protein [Trametopsis cervina]|nr:kinase-like protein [Trametopsis cervina]